MVFWYVNAVVAYRGCEPGRGGVFLTEYFLMIALFCSRNLMIALKYGYMAPSEYKLMCTGDMRAAMGVQFRHQLLTGWFYPQHATLGLELRDAAARHFVDLDACTLTIRKCV